jgi:uncharacterized phage protein (TIGR01671 family)
MNRELKFRIWYYDQKKFDYNVELKDFSKYSFPLYWCKVQQYTGLKDSKGVDIYEGDIVKIEDKEEVRIYDIVFSHGYFGLNRGSKFKHALMYPYTEIIEVIGNIFENPELLS